MYTNLLLSKTNRVVPRLLPFFLTSFYEGERPMLPVIDVNFSKENALPYDLWGLITRD
jgi:hypothetical protein